MYGLQATELAHLHEQEIRNEALRLMAGPRRQHRLHRSLSAFAAAWRDQGERRQAGSPSRGAGHWHRRRPVAGG